MKGGDSLQRFTQTTIDAPTAARKGANDIRFEMTFGSAPTPTTEKFQTHKVRTGLNQVQCNRWMI
jgi:hypothetical protein